MIVNLRYFRQISNINEIFLGRSWGLQHRGESKWPPEPALTLARTKQCLWEKFPMNLPDTMRKLSLLLFLVILQKHSIVSFRCVAFNMISAVMKWNTLFSHVTMFTEPDTIWIQEHLPGTFLLVRNMESICYYHYMKLYAYDKIIFLCLLCALVTWSLNDTDYGQFCQTELAAISLLFLWLAPKTWHSWWPYAFVSIPSTCFPAVALDIV